MVLWWDTEETAASRLVHEVTVRRADKGQIANTIAATSRTPAVSIKISATSKPAIIRIFSMSASLGSLQLMKCSDQKHVRAQGLRHG